MFFRKMLPSLLILATAFSAVHEVKAQIVGPPGSVSITPSGVGHVNRRIQIAVGKSISIDLPREAKDVMIANPAIANASVRSATKIFIFGVALGSTNIHVLDADGRQIIGFDVEIGRDTVQLRSMLKQALPQSNVVAEAVGENIILTGQAANPHDAQKAFDIAVRFTGDAQKEPDPKKVVSALTILGSDQVHLKVTVAEMSRTAIKQLGVNFNSGYAAGVGSGVAIGSNPGADVTPHQIGFALLSGKLNIGATLQWMESNALMRTLAEPTLTSVNGESAKFLAGGEFPVPTARDRDGNTTVTFKPFGVSLVFTPVVMSEGRISLKVGTEVSEISTENQISAGGGVMINGLRVRRADSTLELPSGGTMVLAGLIQETTRVAYQQMPGLGNIPVIGSLFRSREFQRAQTELVILVTPYIVKPSHANQLALPTDNFKHADDVTGSLLGRFNKVYTNQAPAMPSHRTYGYIKD